MTHYLIKSHFSGWHEVSPARFEEYKANWMAHAQAIPADQKEAYFMAHHGQIVEMEEPTAEAKAQAMDAYEKGRISGMDLAGLLSGEAQAKAQAERQARDVEVYTLRAKSWPWDYAPTHRVQVDFWGCGVETSEPCYSEAEALEIYMRELERHGNEAQISLWVYTSTGLEPINYKPHMPAEAPEASTTEEEAPESSTTNHTEEENTMKKLIATIAPAGRDAYTADNFSAYWDEESHRISYRQAYTDEFATPENGEDSNPVSTYAEACDLIGAMYAGPGWIIDWAEEATTAEEAPEELAEYYIARPEYADAIYWDQEPAPIHRDEVARLAREWGLTLEELLAQVEPIAAT